MGLLDHSTNNIILDAVLTDYGRRKLSNSVSSVKDGGLGITQFALGDDEVDYKVIKKYGRSVGKEKIEKNTPIFEAFTNPSIALKNKLFSRADNATSFTSEKLTILTAPTATTLTAAPGVPNPQATFSLNLTLNGNTNVGANNLETGYRVRVPTRFLTISPTGDGTITESSTIFDVGDANATKEYSYSPNTASGATSQTVSFILSAATIDSTTLTVYGKKTGSGNQRQIDVYVTVEGLDSGVSKTFKVSIVQTP